jgi:hypothetical protein
MQSVALVKTSQFSKGFAKSISLCRADCALSGAPRRWAPTRPHCRKQSGYPHSVATKTIVSEHVTTHLSLTCHTYPCPYIFRCIF